MRTKHVVKKCQAILDNSAIFFQVNTFFLVFEIINLHRFKLTMDGYSLKVDFSDKANALNMF